MTAYEILYAISAKFEASQPIYKAEVSLQFDTLTLRLKNQYKPDPTQETDPVVRAVMPFFREDFDKSMHRFHNTTPAHYAFRNIVDYIKCVYERHSHLKNPRQSKLWRWLRSMENKYNHPASEGFLYIYRYINLNSISDSNTVDKDNPHLVNMLAILELMRIKYDVN